MRMGIRCKNKQPVCDKQQFLNLYAGQGLTNPWQVPFSKPLWLTQTFGVILSSSPTFSLYPAKTIKIHGKNYDHKEIFPSASQFSISRVMSEYSGKD